MKASSLDTNTNLSRPLSAHCCAACTAVLSGPIISGDAFMIRAVEMQVLILMSRHMHVPLAPSLL